jgi:hypothetical protein
MRERKRVPRGSREAEAADPDWKLLYRIGAAAALVAALVVRRNLGAELTLLAGLGIVRFAPAVPPVNAAEWFALLQECRLVGLWLLDIFDLVNYALVGLIFIALYCALRRARRGVMMIALRLFKLARGTGLIIGAEHAGEDGANVLS